MMSDEALEEEHIQMACENRFGFAPNVVVGIAMTAVGIVLMLDRLDLMNARDAARYWPILLIMFGASVVLQAFRGGPEGGPGARGQRPIVTPGFVILLVIAGLLAANVLQPRIMARTDGRTDSVVAVMGRAARTSDSRTFTGSSMTTFMGNSRLDLREAMLAPGAEAIVDVFGMMGAVELIVPEGWVVDVEAVPLMGRVDDSRLRTIRSSSGSAGAQQGDAAAQPAAAVDPPRVVVRGFMMMGRLSIRS